MTNKTIGGPVDHVATEIRFITWTWAGLVLIATGFLLGALQSPVSAQSFEYPPVYSRITQPIDESHLVAITGHVHPMARAEFDRGLVDDGMPVEHLIVLLQRTPEQQQAADLLLDQVHNRRSPMYHRWQIAQDFGRHFGPTDEDISKLTNWLRSKGFTIEDVPPGRTHIVITGTAGTVREALHTAIHKLNIAGKEEKAVLSEPLVPVALAPVIAGFYRLYSWHGHPLHHAVDRGKGGIPFVGANNGSESAPDFTYVYNGTTYYDVAPNDWYTIYNVSPLFSAGINGAGQTIAVLEETEVVNQSDVATFRSQFGLPAYPKKPTNTKGGVNWLYGPGNGCSAPAKPTSLDEETEALLDTEWAGVAAPNAMIDFVACATSGSDIGSSGIDQAASYVANYLYSSVVAASLSYGECEIDAGAQGTAYYATMWQQMAFAGITAIVSSGDAGSMMCDQPPQPSLETYATHDLSSNAFASSAYNISAGGTDFSDVYQASGGAVGQYWNASNSSGFASATSYVPEIAWSGWCSSPVYASFLENTGNTLYGTSYTQEAICNNAKAQAAGLLQVVGGGGGVSSYAGLPSWQSVYGVGLGGSGSSTAWRNQPDISLFASNGIWSHALPFCNSHTGYACTYHQASDAYHLAAGGTSFVAPQIAGLMALINEYTQSRQGVANYTLYSLAANEYGVPGEPNTSNLADCSGSMLGGGVDGNCIFRDVAATPNPMGGTVVSDTVQPCLYSAYALLFPPNCYESVDTDAYGLSSVSVSVWSDAYPASSGYDLATGLGSLNAYNLVANWNTDVSFPSTTTLSAKPTTVGAGGTTTLTATVTPTGRGGVAPAAGTVTFYVGGLNGMPVGPAALTQACSGTPPDVQCSPATAKLRLAAAQLNPGPNLIVAEFSGDAANDAPSSSSPVTVVGPPNTATVLTLDSTSVGSSSAVLNGSVNPEGSPGYMYFLFGTTPSPGNATGNQSVGGNFIVQSFTASIGGLASGTTYYYQVVFVNANNGDVQYGAVVAFKTPLPTLATGLPTPATSSSAILNGTVNPEGSPGYMYFLFGTTSPPGGPTGNQSVGANFIAQSFTATIGGLASGTTYYYRMVFVDANNGGVQYGEVHTFKALQPAVATQSATSITSSSAILNGTVNPEGSPGYMYFLFGATSSPGSSTGNQSVGANFIAQSFTATVGGLASGITYYYQTVFVDANNGDVQYGKVHTFKTLQPVVATQPASSITSSSAVLNGSVNPEGSPGYMYFLFGTTSPPGSPTGNQSVGANFMALSFTATIGGLASGATYYYQIVFVNANNGGSQYGEVLSFATLP
jgi:hypothetical protein